MPSSRRPALIAASITAAVSAALLSPALAAAEPHGHGHDGGSAFTDAPGRAQDVVRAGERRTLTGSVLAVQDEDERTADPRYLSTGGELVRLEGALARTLRVGADVTVEAIASPVRADSLEVVRVLAAAAPRTLKSAATTVVHTVDVALIAPAGMRPERYSVADVAPMIQRASDYWSRQTGGKVTFRLGQVSDWRSSAIECARTGDLWQEEMDRTGYVMEPGRHLMILTPGQGTGGTGCPFGLGSVGDAFDGGVTLVSSTTQSLVAHELGHNLGLDHASSVSAPDGSGRTHVNLTPDGFEQGSRYDSYGDTYDVMGYSGDTVGLGNLNVVHREQLGLFPEQQQAVTTSQTVTLRALGVDSGSAPKSIKVTKGAETLYLEYRNATGADALSLSKDRNLTAGVRVLRTSMGFEKWGSRGSVVFDATPTRYSDSDTVVAPGRTWSITGGDLHFQVLSAQGDTAQVKIVYGAAPAPVAPPAPVPVTTSYPVKGAINIAWLNAGGDRGSLGRPAGAEFGPLRAGGFGQHFAGGSIYWSPATGGQVLKGAIRDTYARAGWETGWLGYPTTGEIGVRGGVIQKFQGGLVYWSPATGARAVRGAILDAYGRLGWETGRLGFPTTDETGIRGGAFTHFQGGSIYWSPATGAQPVHGAIRDTWAAQGWEAGRLGFPRSGEYPVAGGVRQDFVGGDVTFTWATGRASVRLR